MEFYVTHINEQTPFEVGEYNVEDYFDLIFVCPFDLDSGIEFSFSLKDDNQIDEFNQEEVPLFMEKARANKLQNKIKNAAKSKIVDFDQIRSEV